jgi:hypothetical protein
LGSCAGARAAKAASASAPFPLLRNISSKPESVPLLIVGSPASGMMPGNENSGMLSVESKISVDTLPAET